MNPALILPLMMRTTRAGMSGISIPPAVSGGLQENQRLSEGAGNKGMQISANLSINFVNSVNYARAGRGGPGGPGDRIFLLYLSTSKGTSSRLQLPIYTH